MRGCIAADNARFAKPPRSDFDAHRPLRNDEDRHSYLFLVPARRAFS